MGAFFCAVSLLGLPPFPNFGHPYLNDHWIHQIASGDLLKPQMDADKHR